MHTKFGKEIPPLNQLNHRSLIVQEQNRNCCSIVSMIKSLRTILLVETDHRHHKTQARKCARKQIGTRNEFSACLSSIYELQDGSCLIYVICSCLRMVVPTTYCFVLFFLDLYTICCKFLWIIHFSFSLLLILSNVYIIRLCSY